MNREKLLILATVSEFLVVGITGCVAAGKTLLGEIMHNLLGFAVLNLDKIAHVMLIRDDIIARLGKFFAMDIEKSRVREILLTQIRKDRRRSLCIISDVLRPHIIKFIRKFINKNRLKVGIALEIPLLFERRYEFLCDRIVAVSTPFYRRMNLFLERSRTRNSAALRSEQDFRFISGAQFSDTHKRCLADHVFYNGLRKSFIVDQLMEFII